MTDDKRYTSLSANTIMAKLTNHFQRTRLNTIDWQNYSLDSEDEFRSGCRNVSHQQQFISEVSSSGRSHYTSIIYWQPETIETRPRARSLGEKESLPKCALPHPYLSFSLPLLQLVLLHISACGWIIKQCVRCFLAGWRGKSRKRWQERRTRNMRYKGL